MSEQRDAQSQRNDAIINMLGGTPAQQPPPAEYGQQSWNVPYHQLDPQAPQTPTSPGFPIEEGRARYPLAAMVLVDAALGLILAILLQVGILFGFMAARGVGSADQIQALESDPLFTLIASPTLGLAFALVAVLRISFIRKIPRTWFNLRREGLGKALLWGGAAGVAFLVVNASSSLFFRFIGSVPDQSEQLTGPFQNATGWQLALLGLFIVVIGPFFEEVFFRGYAQRAISQRLGTTWGIVLSAALFSAPHALSITTGFIGLLIPIFLGGVVLGYVYYRTQNLWSAVLAHSMNNFVGFLGLLALLAEGGATAIV